MIVIFPFDSPSYFEYPKQTNTTKHWHSQRRHDVKLRKKDFWDGSDDDEGVESVKERYEVSLETKRVHLKEHLDGEQNNEE